MKAPVKAVLATMAIGLAIWGSLSSDVRAQDSTDPRLDLAALEGICSDVRLRNNERVSARVAMAARVRPGLDSDAEVRRKISGLFSAHMPLCDGFNLNRGSILKYAVATRTSDFLYSAVNLWDVDLNVVEAWDGRTVLDYVNDELGRNIGRPAEAELTSYRDMLIRAGARTTAQLEAGDDCRPSTRCRQ